MTTVEEGTLINPIMLRFRTGMANDMAAITAFNNQTPGKVVQDTINRFFKCTQFKTVKGEPIWAQISVNNVNQENYSIYVNSMRGNEIKSIKTTYKNPKLIARRKRQKAGAGTPKQVGFYFFQQLSAGELADITNNPRYDQANFVDRTSTGFFTQAQMTARAKEENADMYAYANEDSGGIFGPGGEFAVGASGPSGASGASGRSGASGSRGRGNTRGGGSRSGTGGQPGIAKTIITMKPDRKIFTGSNDFTLPYMKQFINHFNAAESSRERIERIHVFEMIPNSFEFSQLSSQWNETARSGNYPLVDWSNYNLTKVSFRFLVVAKKLEVNQFYRVDPVTKIKTLEKQTSSIVNDGLLVSIDEQLDNIRAMAGAPAPIKLYNVNTLLSTEYRYPYTNNTRNLQWVINDCSITATRFTDNGNSISAAEVSLTLTEYPIIGRDIIPIPPLTPDTPPPPACRPDSGDPRCTPVTGGQRGLWSPSFQDQSFTNDAARYPTNL